ncbi:hypothetical protein AX16_006996 [Volvariella volvacea WC 439]|nr:hypothetical protein AX16_006996 [Volvariella volvacea WC 439]
MFRPIARNVAVARFPTTSARYIHRRPTSAKLQYAILTNRHHPHTYCIAISRSFASSSEPPSSSTEKLAATPTPPPFQGANSTRKSNVDFRPAPRKTPQSSTTVSATQPPTKSSPPTENASESKTALSSKTDSSVGVSEAAKRDIEDAESHGILVPPPPDAGWVKRTIHKGVQLAKFYYRGVKLIFVRRGDIAAIQARIKAGGEPLSRWENRFIRTQKDDVNKVVPFLVIALLLEEVIPLIAIYAPFMLPSTCILPSQRARIEEKKTELALAYQSHYKEVFQRLEKEAKQSGLLPLKSIRGDNATMAVCGSV